MSVSSHTSTSLFSYIRGVSGTNQARPGETSTSRRACQLFPFELSLRGRVAHGILFTARANKVGQGKGKQLPRRGGWETGDWRAVVAEVA